MDYYTLAGKGEGLYKEKGSKFIAHSFPVSTEEQIKERLDDLRKQYHDARHHCYAYVIGMEDQQYRANDDGEPNHSAGDPILGQIRSAELTNTLVVVIRYFGGTKLGVSGLIHAYKTAAEEAILSVRKVVIFPQVRFTITYSYEMTSDVERLLAEYELIEQEREFTDICKVTASIRKDDFEGFKEAIEKLRFVKLEKH
jgi:uncharacterized YigZ family protein